MRPLAFGLSAGGCPFRPSSDLCNRTAGGKSHHLCFRRLFALCRGHRDRDLRREVVDDNLLPATAHAAGCQEVPFFQIAKAIRTILFARATATLFGLSLRFLISRIHDRSFPSFIFPECVVSADRIADFAPSTRRLRRPVSPFFVILPKRTLSPDRLCCCCHLPPLSPHPIWPIIT